MKTKTYLYTCIPCREDNHDDCEIGYAAPEGTGSEGSRCRCACHGKVERLFIADGFGSTWSIKCPECGKDTMVVTRPGKAQCMSCG